MAYVTINDLIITIDEATLITLTDTAGAGVVDTTVAERAIREADAMVDAYVSKVYSVPLSPVPDLVADIAATIAVANLHRYRSIESAVWSDAWKNAVTALQKIADGSVALEGRVAEPAGSANAAAVFIANDRRFSRNDLSGM
jgi:phage gp36-like protein